jgi:hypothetical protein
MKFGCINICWNRRFSWLILNFSSNMIKILKTFKQFFHFYIYFTKNFVNPVYNEEIKSYDLHTVYYFSPHKINHI